MRGANVRYVHGIADVCVCAVCLRDVMARKLHTVSEVES